MSGRVGVLGGVAIRRTVAAERHAARLAGPQMDPVSVNLHALLTFPLFRVRDGRDRGDVLAGFVGHDSPV